ncbi:MAG TPA: transcription antitermination factor NusB [Pirellulales bacterium]|jgi:N utilization substance protein B|nr:transcription antitermination factor NusB [Pirellulales bacterium]
MARRSRGREVALQVLYQDDLNPRHNPDDDQQFLRNRLSAPELIEFAAGLVAGVRRNREALDQVLAETADHWSLERMAATDRNVLRLGAYEILHSDTPRNVAINEAVELAKRFGSRQSAQFVNGILDRLVAGQNKS